MERGSWASGVSIDESQAALAFTVRAARPRNEDNVLVLRTVSLPYFRTYLEARNRRVGKVSPLPCYPAPARRRDRAFINVVSLPAGTLVRASSSYMYAAAVGGPPGGGPPGPLGRGASARPTTGPLSTAAATADASGRSPTSPVALGAASASAPPGLAGAGSAGPLDPLRARFRGADARGTAAGDAVTSSDPEAASEGAEGAPRPRPILDARLREPHPTLSLQLDRSLLCVRVGGDVRWGGLGSDGGYCSRGRHGGALPSMGRAPELRERL